MITRMSKIAVMGPKDMRMQVLSYLQHLRIMEIDPKIGPIPHLTTTDVPPTLPQEGIDLSRSLFLQNLKAEIESLLACLPENSVRTCYIDPSKIIDAIADQVIEHHKGCQAFQRKQMDLQEQIVALNEEITLLEDIKPLLPELIGGSELCFYAVQLHDSQALAPLGSLLHKRLDEKYELKTVLRNGGALLVLITTASEFSEELESILSREHLPEKALSRGLSKEPIAHQLLERRERVVKYLEELAQLALKRENLARQWRPIYTAMADWIGAQLALLNASAAVYETDYCFLVFGWIPTADFPRLKQSLQHKFEDKVIVEEREIHAEELDRIPVALRNPAYFRPFEIFSRLLPLPHYRSHDPTPFIGIFFPVFFGLMLGDIGYGALLLIVAVPLALGLKANPMVINVGKVLGVCALYTVLFGFLFGEFFGDLGHRLFGLEPIYFDRRVSIIPMLLFALAVGLMHVSLGLFLGFLSALRYKRHREALFKLVSVLIILLLAIFGVSFFTTGAALAHKPLLSVLVIGVVLLFVTGGLLAPLEMLKSIGNIISYARIMAVGLTSVLLAYVANQLAGAAGSLIVGILAAIVLHAFNIVLGIFAPTVHSLRLHFVEFFSKFVEHGGHKFHPLDKP